MTECLYDAVCDGHHGFLPRTRATGHWRPAMPTGVRHPPPRRSDSRSAVEARSMVHQHRLRAQLNGGCSTQLRFRSERRYSSLRFRSRDQEQEGGPITFVVLRERIPTLASVAGWTCRAMKPCADFRKPRGRSWSARPAGAAKSAGAQRWFREQCLAIYGRTYGFPYDPKGACMSIETSKTRRVNGGSG